MISVVIPLYNKAHTIANTLSTVIKQTYKDFEIIIVNDGSTDNGVEVIQQHFTDNRIRIINQNNSGVSAARNKGVEESKGEWIAFLDGDDEWHPEYLDYVYNVIRKYPHCGMICSGGLCTNLQSSQDLSYRLANKYLGKIQPIDFFEAPTVFSHSSGTTINKNLFLQTKGFPIGRKCCEDFTCTQIIGLLAQVIYIGLPLTKYIGGVEGQTTNIDKETKFNYLQYVIAYYNDVMEQALQCKQKSKTFYRYFTYDIRHRFKGFAKEKDNRSNKFFYQNLSKANLNLLYPFERFLYRRNFYKPTILWINITKACYKLYHYPIVGEQININNIPSQYRNW